MHPSVAHSTFGFLFSAVLVGPLSGQAVWPVTAKPSLDITTGGDVSHPFHLPVAALRLQDGSIAVADAHAGTIEFFSPLGRRVRTAGRLGDGPGEFRHIAWIGRCSASTLSVWDRVRRRMVVLSTTGDFLREFIVPLTGTAQPTPEVVACNDAGEYVFQGMARGGGASMATSAPMLRGRADVWLADSAGVFRRTLASVSTSAMVIFGGGAGPRPLGPTTSIVLGADRLFVGTADSAGILVFDLLAIPLPSIVLPFRRRATTALHYEQAVDEIVSNIRGARMSTQIRGEMLQLARPPHFPAYSSIMGDGAGLLWVVTSFPGDSSTSLLIIEPETGRARARVDLPVRIKVTDIGSDYILGVHTDSDGAPHLVQFQFRRQ